MMACYYFAGFDNTAVMVVMNLTSTDNVRTRKKRLRQKIDRVVVTIFFVFGLQNALPAH